MIRVLIVDDHSVVRRGLEQILATADGLEVVGSAANGEEAVAQAATLAPEARHLTVETSVTSLSRRELPFLWKQHLALDVSEIARIDLPGRAGLIEDFGTPRAGSAAGKRESRAN